MMKQIRLRFIKISLLALTLAMLLVAGAINAVHLVSTFREINTTLEYLVENENSISQNQQKRNGFPDNEKDTDDSAQQKKQKNHNHMQNTLEESRYFVAVKSADGSLFLGQGSKESEYTESELLTIAEEVFDSGKTSGNINYYQYRVVDKSDGTQAAVFLNCETKYAEMLTLALISLGACVAGVLLSLLLVALLSKKAIKPMMDNIEQQKRFITDAGHELKTPLTVISANMDVLSMDIGENEWVHSTQKQVANMRKLVNELVYLSRMDEADSHLEKSAVNLSKLVQEIAEPFEGMAEFNGKNLILDVANDLMINGDEAALRRLVSTLCDNAIKHAPEDTDTQITLSSSGKNILFATENAMKEPLSKDALDHLFDRFYRADESRSKEKNSGFGIGLSIARAITEKHGGNINAKITENGRLQITCVLPQQNK